MTHHDPGLRREAKRAFGWGLSITLASSGGILAERLTRGDASYAVFANALTSLVVVGAALAWIGVARRRHDAGAPSPSFTPTVAGAGVAVVLVHLALRFGFVRDPGWLSEAPRQLVNDGAAAACILALLWGLAQRPPRFVAVGFALLVLAVYVVTARAWHVDHFDPSTFAGAVSVQEFVLAEVLGVAVALGVLRSAVKGPSTC